MTNAVRNNICILFYNLYRNVLLWVALRVWILFYFLKYLINTNTWKLKRSLIGDIIDSNDTWILGCLLNLKIVFNIRWDVFSKWVCLFNLWDLQIFNWVGEVFKISVFLRSFANFLSPSSCAIFSEDFV